ncbi:MAG TPA: hypothetical protein VIX90_05085 [Edaphobacter sp.]
MSPAKLALILAFALLSPSVVQAQKPFTSNLLESSSLERSSGFVIRNATKRPRSFRPFTTLAIALNVGTLGGGVELTTPLSPTFNLRVGADAVSLRYPYSLDGLDYATHLHLRSARVNLDWFRHRGNFHISPGLFYANNSGTAVASVPPGKQFELGDQPLINTVDDPIGGTSSIVYPRRFAPMLTAGFGNVIPRDGRHFTMPIEFGVAFTGQPHMDVHLNGTACTNQGCFDIAIDPASQQNLTAEIHKLNGNLKKLTVYPILTVGVAYRF